MHNHNAIFNKMVTKKITILTKCFFPYLNPTSYLKNAKDNSDRIAKHLQNR